MLVLLFYGVFLGPPLIGIALAIVIFRWLAKKNLRSLGVLISISIIGLVAYNVCETYQSFYPPDGFYITNFEYYTKLKFPLSAKIISKDASYPDFQGQDCLAAVIRLSENDFNSLVTKVNTDTTFTNDTLMGWRSQYYSKVTRGIDVKNILKIVNNDQTSLEFLSDKTTIVFERGPYPFRR